MSKNPVIDKNGILYASQNECAKAHGVSHAAISYHLTKYGHLNRLHVEQPSSPAIDKSGQAHSSMGACARHHGVTVQTVKYHMDTYGNLDRLGGVKGHVYGTAAVSKPVHLAGRTWPSLSEMARDLQVKRDTLRNWLQPNASHLQRERLRERLAMLEAQG